MAYSLLTHTSKANTGTSGSIDTSGADFLVVAASWTTGGGAIITLTDSKSNVWQNLGVVPNTGSIGLWVAINPTVGTGHTFTISVDSPAMAIASFSGSSLTRPFNKWKTAVGTSFTTLQAGSITPDETNCLVLSAIGHRSTGAASIDGGFTITDSIAFSAGVNTGIALAYLIQTSAAAANPTWTLGASSTQGAAINASFCTPSVTTSGESAAAYC